MYRRTKKSRKINSVLLVVICFYYYDLTWIVTFQKLSFNTIRFRQFFFPFIVII